MGRREAVLGREGKQSSGQPSGGAMELCLSSVTPPLGYLYLCLGLYASASLAEGGGLLWEVHGLG